MPTKKNFLGGQQNYNPKTGEYESALVGKNGKPVEDADGDGKKHESWEKDFSPEEVKKMKNEYPGKEEHINKLKEAGFQVDNTYKAGNTFENIDSDSSISIGEDGKYFRVKTVSGQIYTYKDLDTAIDRAKYISGKSPTQDAIGWENGSYNAEAERDFLMGKSQKKEHDFNDPKERESLKEVEKEFNDEVSDEDIEVELADHEWAVTDKTTVGQYAEMVGGILGIPKERVLEKIKARSSNELDESSLMYKVIDEDTGFDNETVNNFEKPYEKKKAMHTWKSGRTSEIEYVDEVPEGYTKLENATTAPNGYTWYSNNKSLFDKNRDTVLVKDKEEVKYPKGTSKQYTDEVNKKFEESKPILEKLGIKLEDFGGKETKQGGYTDNSKEIMDKYVFEPFRKKYPNGNNDAWEREYQPIYDAIEAVLDKNYNDWYIKKAPYGYGK